MSARIVVLSEEYASGDSVATFTNSYGKVEIAPEAKKQLTGGTLKDGQFEFELLDANGKVIDTAKNDKSGKVTFKALEYTLSDAGKKFTYTVREKIPSGAKKQKDGTYVLGNMTYDGHEDTYTVTVTARIDEESGLLVLEAEGAYSGKTGGVFKNKQTTTKKPSTSKKPSSSRSSSGRSSLAKTGDSIDYKLAVALAGVGGLALVGGLRRRKRLD